MPNPLRDRDHTPGDDARRTRARLVPHLHFAVVDDDVIVLDERTDAYSCLPGAGGLIQVDGDGITAPDPVISQLREAGFIGKPGPPRPAPPVTPVRALPLPPLSSGDLVAAGRFWRAWWREGRRFEARALSDLLAAHRVTARSSTLAVDEIARLTSAFVRHLPWAPGQGACLYRAHLLRTLIRDAGGDVQWVFGVRTWPFSAHCWLQIGDAVLDDEPDRVAVYTPIMVV